MEILSVAHRKSILAEGPLWDPRTERLYWLDIKRAVLEWLRPASDETGLVALPCRASALATRRKGGLLLGTENGFAVFGPDNGAFEYAVHPEPDRVGNRSNDGHTDGSGRFWLGTMNDSGEGRSGAVYRLDPDWSVEKVLDGLGIPNTLIFSPDGRTFYMADSQDKTLFAFPVDTSRGNLGSPLTFATTFDTPGTPDGSAIDVEGCLWNAQWGAARLVRYRPDGTVDRILPMPVSNPTSCAFGGTDLNILYVTSARAGLSQDELDEQPLAGSIFAFEPGVKGAEMMPFEG